MLKHVPRRDGAHRAVKIDNSLGKMGAALATGGGNPPPKSVKTKNVSKDEAASRKLKDMNPSDLHDAIYDAEVVPKN